MRARDAQVTRALFDMSTTAQINDSLKLNSEAYQEQLASALMRGIEGYFSKNPPLARNRPV